MFVVGSHAGCPQRPTPDRMESELFSGREVLAEVRAWVSKGQRALLVRRWILPAILIIAQSVVTAAGAGEAVRPRNDSGTASVDGDKAFKGESNSAVGGASRRDPRQLVVFSGRLADSPPLRESFLDQSAPVSAQASGDLSQLESTAGTIEEEKLRRSTKPFAAVSPITDGDLFRAGINGRSVASVLVLVTLGLTFLGLVSLAWMHRSSLHDWLQRKLEEFSRYARRRGTRKVNGNV